MEEWVIETALESCNRNLAATDLKLQVDKSDKPGSENIYYISLRGEKGVGDPLTGTCSSKRDVALMLVAISTVLEGLVSNGVSITYPFNSLNSAELKTILENADSSASIVSAILSLLEDDSSGELFSSLEEALTEL
ncbi:MAG: hypothetical protein GY861_22030 [bacterium]|nr:hypothetical protein [bacterium]